MDVMFDLETLDVKPSAVILSLGAVKFDPREKGIDPNAPKLSLRISVDEQSLLGRSISESTLEWWSTQSKEAQEAAFSDEGRIPLVEAVDHFHKFVWNSDRIWSQGSFDVNIMEHLYTSLNRPYAWQYWQVRDSRTLFDFIDGNLDRTKHHDAVEDAISQAEGVQRALRKIGWVGEKL
jgi:3' exoribonuclease, RNase T-like